MLRVGWRTRGGQEKIDKGGKEMKRGGCDVQGWRTRGGQEEVGGLGKEKKRLED